MILLDGMGRSGTSLLARLMAMMLEPRGYAYYYEPFHHPTPAGRLQDWEKMLGRVLLPGDPDPQLEEYLLRMDETAHGHLFWKEIRLALKQDWLLQQFPDLKLVHLTRDILGVMSSHRREGAPDWMARHRQIWCGALREWLGSPGNLQRLRQKGVGITPDMAPLVTEHASEFEQYALIWSLNEIFMAEMRHPRLLRVRYEDLCSDPSRIVDEIAEFLGVAVDRALRSRLTAHMSESGEFDASGPAPDCGSEEMPSIWKSRLGDADTAAILRVAGAARGRLGYPQA